MTSTIVDCLKSSFMNCLETATMKILKAFEFHNLNTDFLCCVKVQFV